MDWDFELLQEWDEKICKIASEKGLDWFPVSYEICDYYTMIGHMAYSGMPTHYGHWSFGKSFEQTKVHYDNGSTGLPYELIINSNPSIAYLMRENPAYLQILIMAHCVGHSDFFKNNRMFVNTRPDSVVGRMRAAKKRIQSYIEDPTIGIDEVESVLDAAHALQWQTYRYCQKKMSHDELYKKYSELIKTDKNYKNFDINKFPLEPDYDILEFIADNARKMPDWKHDVLNIVRDRANYFIPNIQTKIMNEGFASMSHYDICHELEMPQEYHIPFIKMHNQVIRPHIGGLNPYHVGFVIFQDIKEKYGMEEVLIARECANDVSFIRQYLTEELCEKLGLFTFSEKKKQNIVTIDDVYNEEGFDEIKKTIINNIGTNGIPVIYIDEVENNGTLVIRHEHDGRDLELDHADNVVKHIKHLWGDEVKLFTIIEEETWEI
jgi:stage V sporulation protein R